jgi:glycosyltransferase involved in cell wall biosynthesis
LNAADKVMTVSWDWAKDFENLCSRQVDVVTNGYDPEDFRNLPQKSANEKFLLCHIGSLNKDRNPEHLWKCLAQIVENDPGFGQDLRIRFIGQVDYKVFDDLIRFNLMNRTEKIEYLPHDETLRKAAESSVLLLLLNNTPNVNGIIPGKVFEYLALKRHILCIGVEAGDSARIINESKAGSVINFGDGEKCISAIKALYQRYKNNTLAVSSSGIEKYSRQEKAKEIAGILNEFVK